MLDIKTYDVSAKVAEVMAVVGSGWSVFPTGSLHINGKGNDCDIVTGPLGDRAVEDEEFFTKHLALIAKGFTSSSVYGLADEQCGVTNHPSGYRMLCYRKGDINLIMVDKGTDNWFMARELLSAWSTMRGQPTTKRDRVLVHSMLVDGYGHGGVGRGPNYHLGTAVGRTLTIVQEDY